MICCLQESCFKFKDMNSLKVKGWKKLCHANSNQNRAGVAILTSGKTELKTNITRDKVRNCIMIIGLTSQDLTMIDIYAPNNRAPKYMNQNRRNRRKK